MRGLDLARYQPRVIILENLHKSQTYPAFMWRHGYRRWKRLKPNEIYIPRTPGFHPISSLRALLVR